jgi:hypothetical protein
LLKGLHNITLISSQPFQIVTDHITQSYLQRMRLSRNSRLARWALALQLYRYKVVYRKGANNVVADAISRVENAPIVPVEVAGRIGLMVRALDSKPGDPGSSLGVAHETNA